MEVSTSVFEIWGTKNGGTLNLCEFFFFFQKWELFAFVVSEGCIFHKVRGKGTAATTNF